MMIQGVITALVTPFKNGNRAVDYKLLKKLVKMQFDAGVAGVLVLGTTGEAPTLTEEEKEGVITAAVEAASGRGHLMVGVSSNDTRVAVAAAKKAERLGADSLLVGTPYYNCPTPEGIHLHLHAICEAMKLPICLYNHPKRTGTNLEPELLQILRQLPHVVAVKEASGDICQIDKVIQDSGVDLNFSVYGGEDNLALPVLALGGDGLISVISNIAPEAVVALVQSALTGNMSAARRWHRQLTPLIEAAFLETNPICVKALMRCAGIDVGSCRLPLSEPRVETLQHLVSAMEEVEQWRQVPV